MAWCEAHAVDSVPAPHRPHSERLRLHAAGPERPSASNRMNRPPWRRYSHPWW